MVLLDFIRYHEHLTGTKIGCREGDCGACTILSGELKDGTMNYTSATSCLMPLGNAHLKHIVTIEGLNLQNELNPIQKAMANEGATQCGFCTPGFVVSLAGFCLSNKNKEDIISSIDGNICRCTGYKSIQRAADRIARTLTPGQDHDPVQFVTENHILPSYFTDIKQKLASLYSKTNGVLKPAHADYFIGGGTDLYVQKHDTLPDSTLHFLFDRQKLNEVIQEGSKCIIGPSATVTDLRESNVLQQHFPRLDEFISLVSSTPIRNMATIAGNFINASPIGDFTIFFLVLNANLSLSDGERLRELPLRKLYKGYKQLDKQPGEFIQKIWFELPGPHTRFNFEKVSKRTNLDIASVNTAIQVTVEDNVITDAALSAGGVAPVPLYLSKSSDYLKGKAVSEATLSGLIQIVQTEITPISDARGSADYKRLLLGQLIKAHFLRLFPSMIPETIIKN